MSGTDAVRCWLVDRVYTDKGLLSLTYATTDGERAVTKNQSLHAPDPTAAVDVDPDKLEAVEGETRERYRDEATRMAERHDPEDTV